VFVRRGPWGHSYAARAHIGIESLGELPSA
jgi:hypothetical protein